jgi:hypothetical protein
VVDSKSRRERDIFDFRARPMSRQLHFRYNRNSRPTPLVGSTDKRPERTAA